MNKAPAYQMYARDWLGSRSVRMMDDFQRGWYIQLLNEAWDGEPQCLLPDDDTMLQRLAGVSALAKSQPDFNDRWTAVKRMFKRQDGGYLCNARQMEEYAKQQLFRQQASAAGTVSAERRREKLQAIKSGHIQKANDRSTTVQPTLNEPTNGRPTESQRKANTAFASASASASAGNTPIPPKGEDVGFAEDLRKRIGAMYHRKEKTAWSEKELAALRKVAARPDVMAEIAEIEANYPNNPYRRRDIQALLNNWGVEVDRVRNNPPPSTTQSATRKSFAERQYDEALAILKGAP